MTDAASAVIVGDRENDIYSCFARSPAGIVLRGWTGTLPVTAQRPVGRRAALAPARLARPEGVTQREMLEHLITAADDMITARPDIVSVEGGAVAHGHPIGAAGAVLTTRLIHSMRRDGLKRGVVTLCIDGGQDIALAIETIA